MLVGNPLMFSNSHCYVENHLREHKVKVYRVL